MSRNRILVLKASRDSGRAPPLHQLAQKRLRPAAQPPAPNSGLGAIAVAAGLLASAVMWNREGHKLKGRQLPAWLEPLRPLLAKLGGTRGSQPRRSSSSSASSAAARQEQQRRRQEQERRQQEQRALAAAAAEQRLQVGRRGVCGTLVGICRQTPLGASRPVYNAPPDRAACVFKPLLQAAAATTAASGSGGKKGGGKKGGGKGKGKKKR